MSIRHTRRVHSLGRFPCAVLGLVFCSFLPFASAEEEEEHHEHWAPPTVNPIPLGSLTAELWQNVRRAGDAIPESSDPILGQGQPISSSEGDDPWSGVLSVTSVHNPLISTDCRKRALTRAATVTNHEEFVTDHIEDHLEEWRDVLQGKLTVRLSTYLKHLDECGEFCGPYIAGILKCHVDAVRNSSHTIIFFEVGRPHCGETFSFTEEDRRALERFVSEIRSRGEKLVLIGRASILGPNEKVEHNRRLAMRRVDVVKDAMIDMGFPPHDIRGMPISWEPPRLVVTEIAKAYGFVDEWKDKARFDPHFMDQSVVLVAY